MTLYYLSGKIQSDCHYKDLELSDIDIATATELAREKQISLVEFSTSEFSNIDTDFAINEVTCGKRVLAPDMNIYYCPGFIELKEPICSLKEFDEEDFRIKLEEFYFKKLYMCINSDVADVRRFCPVKTKCDKKFCFYLNHKLTGDNRFPFNDFCIIKENKYTKKMETNNTDILPILLNCLIKQNEAIHSLGTAHPNPVIKNRLLNLVTEVNENISTIIDKVAQSMTEECTCGSSGSIHLETCPLHWKEKNVP
jgi:hypothetical protein